MATNITADVSLNIRELMQEKKISSEAEFARRLGISKQAITKWKARNTYDISRILDLYPDVSQIWLLTGEGPMLKPKAGNSVSGNSGSVAQVAGDLPPKPSIVWDETERHAGVPIYDVDFACSFVEMYNDFSSHPIGWLSLPPFNDPERYAVVRAVGDSMSPDIEHGALIVLGRQPLPVDRIFYGDMYGIETIDDMRSIKRIVRSEDKGKVRLVPSNPAYGDYQDYPAEAIRRVYKVFHVLNQRSY